MPLIVCTTTSPDLVCHPGCTVCMYRNVHGEAGVEFIYFDGPIKVIWEPMGGVRRGSRRVIMTNDDDDDDDRCRL